MKYPKNEMELKKKNLAITSIYVDRYICNKISAQKVKHK